MVIFLGFHYLFKRLPRKYFYPFWLLLAYRLLSSFHFTITLEKEIIPLVNDVSPLTLSKLDNVAPQPSFSSLSIGASLWFLGLLIFWMIMLYKYLQFQQSLNNCSKLEANIYLTTNHHTAFTTGIFDPKIYLPVTDEQNQDHMLQHELMHIKRHDNWWRIVALVILSIHFFNPLVYLAYHVFIQDLEMSCDEELLKNASPSQVANYCRSLVQCAQKTNQWQPLCFTRNYKEVYQRVKNVTTKKYSKYIGFAIVLVIAVSLGIFFFQFEYKTKADTSSTPPTITDVDLPTSEPSSPPTTSPATNDLTFYAPVDNMEITCGYYCYAGHLAEDITNSQDKQGSIYASAKGKVMIVDKTVEEGNYIIIDHGNDFYSLYANLGEIIVQKNDEVNAKQEIAKLGLSGMSTGPHVHFAIRQIKDVDPSNLLDHFNNEYPEDIIYQIAQDQQMFKID
ncbi:MAG: M23/M56 family metallopeptidase [Erysipelotrichaceae bacterium]|nr:M23/M56 family metallopeptidase [Erysipelotrichaceae bacterium]